MERNIPHNASETIDFYKRTIYSVLRSKSENRISGSRGRRKDRIRRRTGLFINSPPVFSRDIFFLCLTDLPVYRARSKQFIMGSVSDTFTVFQN